MNKDIHTTVINCKFLKNRKQNVLDQFLKHNFYNYNFYINYDAEDLTLNDINKYYSENINIWNNKIKIYNLSSEDYNILFKRKKLNLNEISLTIKYGKIFELLLNKKENYFIIFEDDIILDASFNEKFKNFLIKTPNDWNAIYFSECCGLISNDIQKMNHPASRCTAAVLFKKETIRNLSKTWFPFNLVSDWELSYQHFIHDHNVYWWNPPLIKQGSETALFESTLR